ncbi:MAG: PIN domain-containing protein [Mariniphaga sp.]
MEILADNINVFVDTNILVFANVATSPFHEKAKAKLIELVESGYELWISNQVIREYLAVLSRPDVNGRRIADKALISDVKHLRSEYYVLFESNRTLDNLQMLLTSCLVGGKQVHDANIVATMIENNLKILLTHNVADFIRFGKFITTITI